MKIPISGRIFQFLMVQLKAGIVPDFADTVA